ncbi:hypothetical protein PCANC_17685 [Puccinia coronata f. sp. avenae]|uniref:Uncharacterized protein n=1 Tax=Puccinia coronata f. sp. avenae TaxID=200324 RepID=A0A2N5U973_9BASI|nr:hypothetical protein PCANC_17685 [Puccinia coronata f. sp. avenae]
MILGTPFLSKFKLTFSIPSLHACCDASGIKIFDYQSCNECAVEHPTSTVSCIAEDRNPEWAKAEQRTISEFQDLFLADIPAVLDEAEAEGLFTDASFPEKLQDESLRVRHKIVLTDPNAVINKRQYPYRKGKKFAEIQP